MILCQSKTEARQDPLGLEKSVSWWGEKCKIIKNLDENALFSFDIENCES